MTKAKWINKPTSFNSTDESDMVLHRYAQKMQNFTAWSKALLHLDSRMKEAGYDFLTFAKDAVVKKLNRLPLGDQEIGLGLCDFVQTEDSVVPSAVEVDSEQFL